MSLSRPVADSQDKRNLKKRHLERVYCESPAVRRLPAEILLCIFPLAIEGEFLRWESSRIVIGLVCQQWRSVSRSFPPLWSRIDIQTSFHWHGDRRKSRVGPAVKKELIELCLVQSHPHPLDIVLDFNSAVPNNVEHGQYLDEVFQVLCSHASRWRTFECVGRTPELSQRNPYLPSVFDIGSKLIHSNLSILESLDTMFIGKFLRATMSPIHVPSLRSLRTTLSNANFVSKWTHLTNYSGPFESPKALVEFLSGASNLTSLYITHLDFNGFPVLDVVPSIIHNTLRVLKLNECAISLVLASLTFPLLEEFIMPTLDDWQFTHPDSCFRRSIDFRIMQLKSFVRRSCCPIRVLDLGCANYEVSLRRLMEVLRSCESTVVHLRLYLTFLSDETIPVLEALTIHDTTPTIFPNLVELEIETNTKRDMLFAGSRLEDMLRSRCDVPGGSPLKRLRLVGDDEGMVMADYATSSLSLYLQELRNRGMDVEWMICQNDMLEVIKRLGD